MLTIEEIRDTLPDRGKDLSDEQLLKLRDDMYGLAQICFDVWLAKKNKNGVKSQDDASNDR